MADNLKFSKHKEVKGKGYQNTIIMMQLKYPLLMQFQVTMMVLWEFQ
jgi:hypothetical protein